MWRFGFFFSLTRRSWNQMLWGKMHAVASWIFYWFQWRLNEHVSAYLKSHSTTAGLSSMAAEQDWLLRPILEQVKREKIIEIIAGKTTEGVPRVGWLVHGSVRLWMFDDLFYDQLSLHFRVLWFFVLFFLLDFFRCRRCLMCTPMRPKNCSSAVDFIIIAARVALINRQGSLFATWVASSSSASSSSNCIWVL